MFNFKGKKIQIFFDGVKNCLGDYYATLDYSYFTKHKEDTRNPALYSIRKGRIINVSEPPKGLEFLTDIFKSATGRDEKKVTCSKSSCSQS